MSTLHKKINVFALILLITGAIDSVRNLPSTALFGSQLVFFFIFSAIVFLIPAALISAQFATTDQQQGGIYHWVKSTFGHQWGIITIWLQWINTMVWFPTILSFLAGTAAYLIDPALTNSKLYLVSVILGSFWLLTLLNLKGVKVSAKFAAVCAMIGMIIPLFFMIILAIVWLILGKPLQISLTPHAMFPTFAHSQDWIALTAIMSAYLGMELAAVHVKDIENPQKNFPKAMFFSIIIILFTMILGSLAIAFVLPQNQISLVAGTVQAFQQFLDAYHLQMLTPIVVVMIFIGSVGSVVNWLISPARGLLLAAQDHYLPTYFCQLNKHGVAQRILIAQAVLVSFVCLAFVLMPSVNGSYWLLTDLSTQLYMLMYVLLFAAAIAFQIKNPHAISSYKIPGGEKGTYTTAILGLLGCAITLAVGFFPPEGINVGGIYHYEIVFSLGMLLMIIPVGGLFFYRKQSVNK